MPPSDAFFEATWGRLKLWLSSISTDNSRSLVVHELSSGDVHPVQDRGARIRRSRCDLLFDEMTGEEMSPFDRFVLFKAAVDSGAEAIFNHPIDGSFLAKVGEFTYDIDEHTNIRNVVAEFVAVDEIQAVLIPASGSVSGLAGEGSVTAAADAFDAELEAVDLETDITDDARTVAEEWTEPDVSPRDVIAEVADLSDRIADFIADEELEEDLALFAAYRSAIMLAAAIRAAAIAATSETPAVFPVFVARPVALLALMAKMYGGAKAEERARQVIALNDIRTPGWLTPGQYIMPARTEAERAVF